MKQITQTLLMLFLASATWAQPKLYIHIVSHNEPTDTLQIPARYQAAKTKALQMAGIIDTRNVKWNLQTSDGFVLGARNDEWNTGTNIFETLANAPYDDNIEIDPRNKNLFGRNIADQWYLLDSLGANPTHTLGGFIYYTTDNNIAPIDWEQYRNPIIGNVHGNSWQCTLLSGAGSYQPHTHDLNDFGVFKPDTATNFYQHNPARNLWCMGTGCAPVLDSLDDEQAIIDLIQGQVDSIQNGLWPSDRFYVTRIMTNQREYGPMFFQKITKVIDSLNLIPSTQLQWANITEAFTDFQAWQVSSGKDYSQWLCGETYSGVSPQQSIALEDFSVFPNPTTDKVNVIFTNQGNRLLQLFDSRGALVQQYQANGQIELDVSSLAAGLYLLREEGGKTKMLVKQ